MKVIGLTGGIGTGKSNAASVLAELGAVVIDADKVGHEIFQPCTEAWNEVVAIFGKEVTSPKDGTIDRKKLGEIVFHNPDALDRLNRIMHRRIFDEVKRRLVDLEQRGTKVAVVEASLLIEAGWTVVVDEVWVTDASEETVLKRLLFRSGLSQDEALARIHSQLPAVERMKRAHVIINTEHPLKETRTKIEELWRQRIE